MINMMSCTTL